MGDCTRGPPTRAAARPFPQRRRCRGRAEHDNRVAKVNFQVTVLKILASYPDGFAPMADLKRDMTILATSGRDWADRTKRLGTRLPDLDIFSQKFIERMKGGWRITEEGRAALESMEARPTAPEMPAKMEVAPPGQPKLIMARFLLVEARRRRHERRRRHRLARERRGVAGA